MSDDLTQSLLSRRQILLGGAALAGGAALMSATDASALDADHAGKAPDGRVYTPNGTTAQYVMRDGVKVFHLKAHEFQREFTPGLQLTCWGWNGSTPGPTIEVDEGDRCRFYVTNELPEATTVHWHGVILPNGMDGVGGLNQEVIPPGQTFIYEFTFTKPGTFMYHPHADEMTQMAMGMVGMIVVHPKRRRGPKVDRDYCMMLHQWKVHPGTSRPDPNADSGFNILTINSKVYPSTSPLIAKTGERVRMRFGNLSAMEHHPIHLHGYAFELTQTDGGDVPASARWPETTVLVPVGSVRVVEFVADAPGDWAMHCHMTHHIMNQMGHDIPNLVGAKLDDKEASVRSLVPGYMTMGTTGMGGMGEMQMSTPHNSIPMKGGKGPHGFIDMGGMFTIVKVRDNIDGYEDPGWYKAPTGTQARKATPDELARDGIT